MSGPIHTLKTYLSTGALQVAKWLTVVLAACSSGCGASSAALPDSGAHQEAVPTASNQTRVPAGPPGTAALPAIEIRDEEIRLDGRVVGSVKSIVEVGRLTKIDELFVSLRSRRDGAVDGGASVGGECVVDSEGAVPWLVVESVVRTAAFAGYPRAWMRAGAGWVRIRTPVPGPPGAPLPELRSPLELGIDVRTGEVEAAVLESTAIAASESSGGGFERTIVKRDVFSAARAPKQLPELAAAARGQKAPPCFDPLWFHAAPTARLDDIASLLSSLARYQRSDGDPRGAIEVTLARAIPQAGRFTSPPGSPRRVRLEATEVSGRLAPVIIQQTVRASFGEMRKCYEDGLRRDPNLAGRISVRFVIDQEGKVSAVGEGEAPVTPELAGSPPRAAASPPLPDRAVVACVLAAFEKLTFPKPEGGIVTVVYPIQFSPGS